MSKRSKLGQVAAVDAGNDQITVVDGNAVGVAPSGDTATVESNDDAAVAAILDAVDATPEVVETADEIDPEILALLGDDSTPLPTAPVADPDPVAENAVEVVATEEEEIEVEAPTEDEILAELEDEPADASTPADTSTAAAPKTKRKAKAPAAPTAPARVFTDVAAIDPAAFKTNLDGSTAKKVNEKVQNLIQAIETGKKLSNYTAIAVKRLVADGKISGKSLVEAYTAANLKLGTARAQSQQMTALFKIAGLVTPSNDNPRELVLADANLANELATLAA